MRNDSTARKKAHTCYVLETVQLRQQQKDISCYILETVQLMPIKKRQQLPRTGNSITDTRLPGSCVSCVFLNWRRERWVWTAALANPTSASILCILDAPKQRARYHTIPYHARYHALLEQLGFHKSFEELVKHDESFGAAPAPCMPYFGTTVSSLLQSVDSHGLWGSLTVGSPSPR